MKVKVHYEICDEAVTEVDDRYKSLIDYKTFNYELANQLQICIERKLGLGEDNIHISSVWSEDDELIYANLDYRA